MKRRGDSARYLVVYCGKDRPWADWIADQLTRGGLPCEALDAVSVREDFPPERIIVVDSTEIRHFAGRLGPVALIIGIDTSPPFSTVKGRTIAPHWGAHLSGLTEADASRQLWMAVERKLGVSPLRNHDAARGEGSGVPYPAPATIFISYRRVDNAGGAITRLHASLKARLPEARVFLDVADPDPESDVTKRLDRALRNTPILLAVIGPDWRGNRVGRQPRIFDTGDFVHHELAQAGESWRRARVVVVLLDGGYLPPARELPEDIQYITRLPCERLDMAHFDRAVASIAEFIEAVETRHSRFSGRYRDGRLEIENYSVRPFSRPSD